MTSIAYTLGQVHGMQTKRAGLAEELAQTGQELGAMESSEIGAAQGLSRILPFLNRLAGNQARGMAQYEAGTGTRPSTLMPQLRAQGVDMPATAQQALMQAYQPAGAYRDFDPDQVYAGDPTFWQRVMGFR